MYPHFKVYVGCSLTHASEPFKAEVERFKEKLRGICTVMCFLGTGTDALPRKVYSFDIHECVYKCHLMIAICDQPSTGLGYEMATQVEARKMPLLGLAHKDAKVSDLILDTGQPGFTFYRYIDLHTDAFEKARKVLEGMDRAASEGTLFEATGSQLKLAAVA